MFSSSRIQYTSTLSQIRQGLDLVRPPPLRHCFHSFFFLDAPWVVQAERPSAKKKQIGGGEDMGEKSEVKFEEESEVRSKTTMFVG